jgi:hypothetical protein
MDNGWVLSLIEPVVVAFDQSIVKYPNIRRLWKWVVERPALQPSWTATVLRLRWPFDCLSSLWLDLRREGESHQRQEVTGKFHRYRDLSKHNARLPAYEVFGGNEMVAAKMEPGEVHALSLAFRPCAPPLCGR